MAKGTALWFINGKVCNDTEYMRIWKAYDKRREHFYAQREQMEKRHRKEAEAMEVKRQKMLDTHPFIIWVGTSDEGPVEAHMKIARSDYARRKSTK